MLDNATVDRKYLFVEDKLVAVRFDIETRNISYEKVKEALSAKGEFTALDIAILGNGIYAVDDDGTPELNVLAFVDAERKIMTILELDDDGDDIDVTIVDLSADYIK
jgi:hypothetical protein